MKKFKLPLGVFFFFLKQKYLYLAVFIIKLFLNMYDKLVDVFLDWNSKINLSAIRDKE
jgi:16S rRNA G527 N7-methylase RsmG